MMEIFGMIFKKLGTGRGKPTSREDNHGEKNGLCPQELLTKTGKQNPKTYFHTHIVDGYNYNEGVRTYERHDSISDFFSWSLFFPFEKMDNQIDEQEFVSLTNEDGKPNFKITLMSESAAVYRVTDRYRRAFVGRVPLENPTGFHTHHVPREFALGELAITHELLQKISELKLAFASLKLSESDLSTKIKEVIDAGNLWQANETISTDQVANRIAHSVARSFTLAFVPAIFRMLEYKTQQNLDIELELRFILSLLDKLESKTLVRYVTTKLAHYYKNQRLSFPKKYYQKLEAEQVAKIYLEITGVESGLPRTLIVPRTSTGSADPAYRDFFSSYFGSGELTYIVANNSHSGFQELIKKRRVDVKSGVSDPALAVLIADSYKPEERIRPFRLLDHIENPWVFGQMTNQITEQNRDNFIHETMEAKLSNAERAKRYARNTKIWMLKHDALVEHDDVYDSLFTIKRRIEDIVRIRSFDELEEIVLAEFANQVQNQARLVYWMLRGKKFENTNLARNDLLELLKKAEATVEDASIELLIRFCEKGDQYHLNEDELSELITLMRRINSHFLQHL